MSPHAHEWLSLVIRWAHVIAGITWIGHALFFNWLDASLEEPDEKDPNLEGELWMVHSGGFYRVLKKLEVSNATLDKLHWFKWEAAFTWFSGFFLLGVVYYMGGGALLVDRAVSDISVGAATGIGIGTLVLGWGVYDLLWQSPIGKNPKVGAAVSFSLLVALVFGLTQLLSGRAAYIHIGALFGTLMVANVWMRIIPAQRNLVSSMRAGEKPDHLLALRAKTRSVHNNYMTYPLIFIMISNHYYQTFGAELNWLILTAIMIAGASVRRLMNLRGKISPAVAVVGGIAAGTAVWLTLPQSSANDPEGQVPAAVETMEAAEPAPAAAAAVQPSAKQFSPGSGGTISGKVAFTGAIPEPKPLGMISECAAQHSAPVFEEDVVVQDGGLANVLVQISAGLDGWSLPPVVATEDVVLDQKGCVYNPRVVAVQAGQSVTIVNSDPLLHNVHAVAKENAEFNLAMPVKGMRMQKRFDKAERVQMKCDVHPWMKAFIGVVDHPYVAVTDAQGKFSLGDVPPGEYTLTAWHERFGEQTAKVTVLGGGEAEAGFSYSGS